MSSIGTLRLGALIGAVIVAIYCFAGGIRASIWTDAVQSVVMLGAITLVIVVALVKIGGFGALWSQLGAIDPNLTVIAPTDYKFGFAGYVLGWMGAGAGVIGQPHVMIRAMAIDSPDNIAKARRIYIAWYSVFSACCVGVGLAARVLYVDPTMMPGGDAELALPFLSGQLLPGVLVGLMLAGIFAATISTADSQILSCSAAVTRDIEPRFGRSVIGVKIATVSVTVFALIMTLYGPDSVFKLVTLAWATLAAGLGPLMVIRVFHMRINATLALATMAAGVAGALSWRFILEYHNDIYDVLPGMLSGFVVYAIGRQLIGKQPTLLTAPENILKEEA